MIRSTPNRHWQLVRDYSSIPRFYLLDVHTGNIARRWDHRSREITGIEFSPDGSLMAIAGSGAPVDLYQFYKPRSDVPSLQEETTAQLIDQLGGHDAGRTYHAICELVRRGDESLEALRSAVVRQPLSEQQVAELILQLDSGEEAARDAATQKLLAAPENIAPGLRQALEAGGTPEKLERLKRITAQFRDGDSSPYRLTIYRIVEVLEAIHSPTARKLLEQLADGDTILTLTHEARAALTR